jgi:thiol-disulfide isomerase/thioredoxin
LKTSLFFYSFVFLTLSCASKKSVIAQDSVPIEAEKAIDSLETYVDIAAIKIDFATEKNLSEILDLAASKNKIVYLDVNASWCTPCKLMQRDVYSHAPTASFFNSNFVNHIVDIEKGEGPDLKLIYDIKVIPTLLWLDSRGRVLHRKEGAAYHAELIKNAEAALQVKQ